MSRKVLMAGLAMLILASAADACFCKRRIVPTYQYHLQPMQPYVSTNQITILFVNGVAPGTNGAIAGTVPLQTGNQVTFKTNYSPGTDKFSANQSPDEFRRQLKIVKIEMIAPGTWISTAELNLSANQNYTLQVEDDTLGLYSQNTVTFTTGN